MHTQLRRLGALTASTALLGVASAGVFAPAASAQTNVALNAAATATVAGLPALSCSLGSGPENAVDGAASNIYTDKWCVLAGNPTLNIALPAATNGWTVSKIVIKHAGVAGENAAFNTRAYTLTGVAGATKTTIATVTANTANQTVHDLNLANQSAIELRVDTPTQGTNTATRIYEVEVWALPSASPACTASQRIVNPGFETGVAPWVQTGTVVKPDENGIYANGDWYAGLKYNGDSITQTTTTEPGCVNYKLTYKLKVFFSLWTSLAPDKLYVTLTFADGSTYTSEGASNLTDSTSLFVTKTIFLPRLAPGTFKVRFWTQQDATYPTSFIIDDVKLFPDL